MLPVLTLIGPDADEESKKDVCPACGAADGIRFLGSAIATQLSVTLSTLFGDKHLDAAEKKALVFTDSVQDAAHRAGFVQARSHSLTLRTALRGSLGDAELDLDELARAVIDRAGNDPMLRYQLLPPDLVDRDEFVAFWQPDAHPNSRRAAENKAKRRLRFDVDLEFGCSPASAAPWNSPAAWSPRSTSGRRTRRRSSGGVPSTRPTPPSSL